MKTYFDASGNYLGSYDGADEDSPFTGTAIDGFFDGNYKLVGGVPVEIISELEKAITAKKEAIDALHLSKNTADFTSGGNVYDASPASQLNIGHAISYGELNSISGATTRPWTLADNSTVTVTWTALRTMATDVFDRSDANHTNCRTHKDAVGVLSTVAAVNGYVFSTGWT